jgi:predicted transcriptional regulator of viral defense system
METLLKPLQVRETLLDKNVRTFTPHDFEAIFNTSPTRTKYFLETQTTEGLFTRLKKGMYALKTDSPSNEEIANSIYRPSYVSFEYALAYYGMIPEMPYAMTSATTKPTRDFVVNEMAFNFFTIKPEAYTGYMLVRTNRRTSLKNKNVYFSEMENITDTGSFLIAEPEKALVDYLYFVSLGKKTLNDRLYVEPHTLSRSKLKRYARLYNRKKLTELIESYL